MPVKRFLQIVLVPLIALLIILPVYALLNTTIAYNDAQRALSEQETLLADSVNVLQQSQRTRSALEIAGTGEADRARTQFNDQSRQISELTGENGTLQRDVEALEADLNRAATDIARQASIINTLDAVVAEYQGRITPTPSPTRNNGGQSIDFRVTVVEATPEAEITPEVTPEPIYEADFEDEIQDEWYVGVVIGSGKTSIDDGVYRMTVETSSGSIFVTHPPIIDNFRYSATMSVADCPGGIGGLIYRVTNFETAYMFLVDCGLTTWISASYDQGDITVLEVGVLPETDTSDETVQLTVIAEGDATELFFDEVSLAVIEDDTLDEGLIGLYVQTASEMSTFSVAFDDIRLWQLDDDGVEVNERED